MSADIPVGVHRVHHSWMTESLKRGHQMREKDFSLKSGSQLLLPADSEGLQSSTPPTARCESMGAIQTEPFVGTLGPVDSCSTPRSHKHIPICQLRVLPDALNPNDALIAEMNRLADYYATTLAPTAHASQSHDKRALAYKRIVASLRGYPWPITSGEQALRYIKHINQKTAARIDDFLETGRIAKTETLCNTQYAKSMYLFVSIHGVGVNTAQKWYDAGCRSLDDIWTKGIKLTQYQEVCEGLPPICMPTCFYQSITSA